MEVASGQIGLDDPTVAQLLERWLAHLEDLGRSPATLYNYRRYVDRELVPTIGGVRLSKLTASHLDRVYSSLRRRGLAPATIRQIHAIVRAALNQAVRWGLVSRNVASLASAPSQPQREQQPPCVAEVVALMDAAEALEPMFGLYVRVVAATGMRRSEACGLRWSDIDLEDGRLVVQRSHLSLPGSVGDRPTKTRSIRTVTLDDDTVAALKSAWLAARELARFAGVDDERRRSGYVFSFDADGAQAWRGDTVDARWSRTRHAAGVTSVRLHDLRHWQATQLLDAGVPVPTVAARLGHADGTTTMKIYAHRTVRGDEMAAQVVGAASARSLAGRVDHGPLV
ncbi:MAG TPA: tyrosine-type recombinase/integrase [Jiangellaceae bacterium]|nr:tyrosine-type recombinase/integrase [Jiangellaceae bacterium]